MEFILEGGYTVIQELTLDVDFCRPIDVLRNHISHTHSKSRSSVGVTDVIPVFVGLHQGSAFSPYLIDYIMDVPTKNVRTGSLVYDIVL